MKRVTSLLCVIASTMPVLCVAALPEGAIKVSGEQTKACMEYFTYQGETYCSTKPLLKRPVDPEVKDYETQIIMFDDRPWQAAWGKKSDEGVTVEYVPMGDDINNWHELVTSQYFPGLQDSITPKKFADLMIEGIKKSGFEPIVTFHKDSADEVIFEFRIEKPAAQVQDELQLIRRGKNGIYVLHYAIKEKDMSAARRKTWLKVLEDSRSK